VFQSYALYPHMSVRDNLAFPLRMAGMDAAEQERRVTAAAEVRRQPAVEVVQRPREPAPAHGAAPSAPSSTAVATEYIARTPGSRMASGNT